MPPRRTQRRTRKRVKVVKKSLPQPQVEPKIEENHKMSGEDIQKIIKLVGLGTTLGSFAIAAGKGAVSSANWVYKKLKGEETQIENLISNFLANKINTKELLEGIVHFIPRNRRYIDQKFAILLMTQPQVFESVKLFYHQNALSKNTPDRISVINQVIVPLMTIPSFQNYFKTQNYLYEQRNPPPQV